MTRFPDFDRALETRLVTYCAIDSQSDETSSSQPSTDIQLDMQNHLVAELHRIGALDVTLTEYGAVLATVPATVAGCPTIGFCAHVDTAPQFNATGVKPRVHKAWDGADITFPDNADLHLGTDMSDYLASKVGDDIITASGLTLLGADDKSGVAIIMTLAEHLLKTPDLKHGKIRLAFTPDEEIGRGVDERLPAEFGADFAFTLDGSRAGSIEFESFSADGAVVQITGVSAHPGFAKNKLVNALHIAGKIIGDLDVDGETPETTDGRDGFIHVYDMAGGSSEATLKFILRDFEMDGLEARRQRLRQVCEDAKNAFPGTKVSCEITKQYRNMRYWLEKDMTPVDLARDAYSAEGLDPRSVPIRGGTDGSRFTELGIPCPNLFTGMQEIHGPLEWISVQDMAMATRICLRLVEAAAR
ncbi:peptidase T [Shimia thalassica]|uniref:peptidase T n=1 Tax=Shimia thalassica TaxID=1715693 RepID=UPI001C0A24DA|nr:peptidase T [Shimia thalassica]MBU2944016.1 peptidase T [Shimia thalassica]MDO6503529.1 peptidase T [Shimia thalassica]